MTRYWKESRKRISRSIESREKLMNKIGDQISNKLRLNYPKGLGMTLKKSDLKSKEFRKRSKVLRRSPTRLSQRSTVKNEKSTTNFSKFLFWSKK